MKNCKIICFNIFLVTLIITIFQATADASQNSNDFCYRGCLRGSALVGDKVCDGGWAIPDPNAPQLAVGTSWVGCSESWDEVDYSCNALCTHYY
jgi:hypothetical protein